MPAQSPNTQSPNSKTDQDAAAAAEADVKAKAAAPIEEASPSAKFIRSVIGEQPKKKPEASKESLEGDEGKQKPAPKKKPAPAAAAPAGIDENKLGAAIGRSIAEHTKADAREKADAKDADKPKPTPKQEQEDRRIAVLERMEANKPERYKGIAARYKENQATLQSRKAAWEKENPGENYGQMLDEYERNPDAHPDFAEEAKFVDDLDSQTDWDDDDFDDAKYDLRDSKKLDEKIKPLQAKLDERLSEVERAEKARKASRETEQVAYAAGNDCWKALGDDFSEVVNKDGSINVEALKSINEADPVKHDIAVDAARVAEIGAMKIHMLANDLEKWDPKNGQHVQISQFAHDMEQRMLSKPPEDQIAEDGRKFSTKAQFEAMSPEQKARHFIFSPDDLKALWVHDVAKQAKAALQAEDEKFTRRAKARGLISDEDESAERQPRRPATRLEQLNGDGDEQEDEDTDKPVSPAFSISPKLSAGKGGARGGTETGAARFLNKLIG